MKYVSTDIETTGINKDWCDIIEFGAIIEDTNNPKSYEDCPKFHRCLKPPREEGYRGEVFALDMHAKSGILGKLKDLDVLDHKVRKFEKLSTDTGGWENEDERRQDYKDLECYTSPRKLLYEFSTFLVDNGYKNTNKNPSGPPMVNLGHVTIAGKNFFAFDWYFLAPLFGERVCRRSIDPSILWWDPVNDERIPSTPECLERAGLKASNVHTSLGDAWDIIMLTRLGMNRGSTG